MFLLVTDTSGKHGSVALARAGEDNQHDLEVIEVVQLEGGSFSALLVPQIAALLARQGRTKADMGAFIVVSGPGSFTGLRVGLAAIKALAEILKKPIAAVSLLEVVAKSAALDVAAATKQATQRYAVALDAGRGEAFVGQFEIALTGNPADAFRSMGESLLGIEALAELIESGTVQWIATPDAAIADSVSARVTASLKDRVFKTSDRPQIDAVARVGWHKLEAGETVSPELLDANYMRRSDAELFVKSGS